MPQELTEAEKEERFKALFERARKGVLKLVVDKGGSLPMEAMHDYSLNTFFIQHQRFSKMMESFVEEQLIDYDPQSQVSTITAAGRKFIE